MLTAQQVGKSYKKELILHDISFELKNGEILGLVGESGCGKSTLARLLCCYEKPSAGKVLYKGKDTQHAKKAQRSLFHRDCQLILQDSLSSLDPTMTIGKTLHEALKYNGYSDAMERKERIEKQLDRVMLSSDLLNKFPMQLSGGERQRINICRALLVQPKILICDEITSSLDVITQYHLLKMLKQINAETGLQIIFISHDINAVKSISDRIIVMHDGTVAEEIYRASGFAYNGKYTKQLFESLPIIHPSMRQGLSRHFAEELFSQ